MSGYSQKMYHAVADADRRLLGVQLGAACIDAEIPVQVAAQWFGVTRQGMYYWFTGETGIAEKHRIKTERIIRVLLAALDADALPAADLPTAMKVIKKYKGLTK